jgi:hypothetical protein
MSRTHHSSAEVLTRPAKQGNGLPFTLCLDFAPRGDPRHLVSAGGSPASLPQIDCDDSDDALPARKVCSRLTFAWPSRCRHRSGWVIFPEAAVQHPGDLVRCRTIVSGLGGLMRSPGTLVPLLPGPRSDGASGGMSRFLPRGLWVTPDASKIGVRMNTG